MFDTHRRRWMFYCQKSNFNTRKFLTIRKRSSNNENTSVPSPFRFYDEGELNQTCGSGSLFDVSTHVDDTPMSSFLLQSLFMLCIQCYSIIRCPYMWKLQRDKRKDINMETVQIQGKWNRVSFFLKPKLHLSPLHAAASLSLSRVGSSLSLLVLGRL